MKLKIIRQLFVMSGHGIIILMLKAALISTLFAAPGNAQKNSIYDVEVRLTEGYQDLDAVLNKIEKETGFKFSYDKIFFNIKEKVNIETKKGSLGNILAYIAKDQNLSFKRVDNTIYIRNRSSFNSIEEVIETENPNQYLVSGTVISSEEREPLPGVSIIIKGTTNGTTTDINGNYKIEVEGGDILQFSYIGYETQEISVGNQSNINVSLTPDLEQLEEVVVVGYGSTKKKDLTGSVATVSGNEMSEIPSVNFEQGLQGRVAGVQVTQTSAEPGGGISVRIRGTNSLQATSEPLYVIDGFPIINTPSDGGNPGGIPINPLSSLNPADIASVEVLKDASATAIYGSRGSNGVVIITTKKGEKGKGVVEFQHFTSISSVISKPIELANAQEFAQFENDRQDALFNGVGKRYTLENGATPEQIAQTYGNGTDWFDEILRTGVSQNYQLNLRGGTETVRYYLSGNYMKENGIVTGTGFARGGIRANVNANISDKVSAEVNFTYTRSSANRTVTSASNVTSTGVGVSGGYPTVISVLKSNPITAPSDPINTDNNLTRLNPAGQPGDSRSLTYNPLREITDSEFRNTTDLLLANMDMAWKPWKFLKVNFRGGANIRNEIRETFFPLNTSRGWQPNGFGILGDIKSNDYLFENFATYTQSLGTSNLEVVAGYSYQEIFRTTNILEGTDYQVQSLGINDFGQASFNERYNRTGSETKLLSFYSRVSYNLLDRYLFTFTGRYDGSSVFAANNKYAFFPSGAVAWRVSDEAFMDNLNLIDNLKLRASYGFSGNQAIAPYQSLAAFGVGGAGIDGRYPLGDGSVITGFTPQRAGNANLKWEKTGQLNFGIDIGFVENRFRITADYYQKRTEDLLQSVPLPGQSGFSSILDNLGLIENNGIEIDFSADVIASDNFNWTTSLNFSSNRSKVIQLADADTVTIGNAVNSSIPTHVLIEGKEVGLLWGRPVVGLLTESDIENGYPIFNGNNRPGAFKYEDVDGNGIINGQDVRVIGNPNPDFLLGWNNTFKYKNFDFTVFLQGVFGQDILNVNKALYEFGWNTFEGGVPSKEYLENRWTPENPNTNLPTFQEIPRDDWVNDRMIENGSFLRLKNLMIGYTMPSQLAFINSMRVYVSGQNLLTFTDYSGFDPEVNNQSGAFGAPRLGVDAGAYPRSRSFTIGVNLGF